MADRTEFAEPDPLAFRAVTRTRMRKPMSAVRTPYVLPFAPGTGRQFLPSASQRCHAYAYAVGLFDQLPSSAVSSSPTRSSPRIDGRSVFCGAELGVTAAVGAERAAPAPSTFTASTRTRIVRPASAGVRRWVFSTASGTFEQAPPAPPQRCHWYWYSVGWFVHVPFCAVRVPPTVGVPVIVGSAVFAGGAAAATPAPARASSVPATVATRLRLKPLFRAISSPLDEKSGSEGSCSRPGGPRSVGAARFTKHKHAPARLRYSE